MLFTILCEIYIDLVKIELTLKNSNNYFKTNLTEHAVYSKHKS